MFCLDVFNSQLNWRLNRLSSASSCSIPPYRYRSIDQSTHADMRTEQRGERRDKARRVNKPERGGRYRDSENVRKKEGVGNESEGEISWG